jgi:5S rRNA maturation endonuclease (ribonuclease M5)
LTLGKRVNSRKTYLAKATEAYAEQMRNPSAANGAIAYLTEHGIGEYEIASRYRLGYVARPLPGDERFSGRLAIPYLTRTGTAAIKYRKLAGDRGSKYDQHHGQKSRLYNTAAYFSADQTIGLCEGEIDAIVATERLNIPTMGIPGSDVWSKMASVWSPIFKDYRRVIVFADGDDAGKRLGDEVAESLGWRARIVNCDMGEDVGSMVAAGKANDLRQLARE